MAQSNSNDLDRFSAEWSTALAHGDLNSALSVAVEGYLAAATGGGHVQEMMFLGFVRHAADALFTAKAKNKSPELRETDTCSFCLKKKTRLVRGVGVAICSDCADLAKAHSAER